MATLGRIALIPEEGVIEEGILNPAVLVRTAVAIDKQVKEHLRPIWQDVPDRTVVACPTMHEVQEDDWHVFLVKTDPGFAFSPIKGFHLDEEKPFATVEIKDDWQLIASHEVLEMLVDPTGDRLIAGNAPPDAKQGRVQFLVEVCDPCEQESYHLDDFPDVPLAYFYTPRYFDSTPQQGVQYAFKNIIKEPRQVLPGGYLSWFDPDSKRWFQKVKFGDQSGVIPVDNLSDFALKVSLRSQIDRATQVSAHPAVMRKRDNVIKRALSKQQKIIHECETRAKALRARLKTLKEEARQAAALE
jgi:hypothetical protein